MVAVLVDAGPLVARPSVFRVREQERVLFYDAASPDLSSALTDPERWYVTDVDDDS